MAQQPAYLLKAGAVASVDRAPVPERLGQCAHRLHFGHRQRPEECAACVEVSEGITVVQRVLGAKPEEKMHEGAIVGVDATRRVVGTMQVCEEGVNLKGRLRTEGTEPL